MPQVRDVMQAMDEIAPLALAEPWDNVGLMFGSPDWPVAHVLLALDATPAVVAQADGLPEAMIVTHHPLFFDPIRALIEGDMAFGVVPALARGSIALFAAHTNLDRSPTHGTAAALAVALAPTGGEAARRAEIEAHGLWALASLVEPITISRMAELVRERLGAAAVHVIGSAAAADRIALIPGSGGDELAAARAAGAQVAITGEIKHHQAIEAGLLGPTVITAGHFETERPVLGLVQAALRERLPGLDVRIAEESSPVRHVLAGDPGG